MPSTNETTNLPAPISLTLDEASQVAAGVTALQLAPWWWFGQPAYITQVSQATIAGNIAAGQLATFGH